MAVDWLMRAQSSARVSKVVPPRLRPAARAANLVLTDVGWRWVAEGSARWRTLGAVSADFFRE